MGRQYNLSTQDYLDEPARKRYLNQELFSVVAPRYACATRLLSLGRDQAWKRMLIESLPVLPSPVCVDLACGTGDITLRLAQQYPMGSIVGIDLTESMLKIARRRCSFDSVRFVCGDMSNTGLPDHSVDLVTGAYALRNAASLPDTLGEIHRILKPGGMATFLDFAKPPHQTLQRLELLLLSSWGGLLGFILHGNSAVYGYISQSLQKFPDRIHLSDLCRTHGLHTVSIRRFFAGIIELRMLEMREDTGAIHGS